MTWKGKPLTEEQLARARCEVSPTGAHHWIIPPKSDLGRCKYCDETRRFAADWAHNYAPPTKG